MSKVHTHMSSSEASIPKQKLEMRAIHRLAFSMAAWHCVLTGTALVRPPTTNAFTIAAVASRESLRISTLDRILLGPLPVSTTDVARKTKSATTAHRSILLVANVRLALPFSHQDSNPDDDDGWGSGLDDRLKIGMDKAGKDNKVDLAAAATGSTTPPGPARLGPLQEQERDLFIPIISVLSILGFAGLYGYEMLRLYFAGELYLPFLH